MRAMRRTCTFSPTLAITEARASSTVSPDGSFAAFRASMSAASSAAWATALVKLAKFSSLATKSVSELTSTSTALPAAWAAATRPSAATRSAFLSALARPDLRSASAAASMSPLFSVSAFLHSIMPAPVRSRSSLTMDAVISIGGPRIRGIRAEGRAPAAGGWWRRQGLPAAMAATPGGAAALPGSAGGLGLVGGFAFLGGLLRRAARGLRVGLDELVLAHDGGVGRGGLALEHRVGGGASVQLHGADGVVVARDRVVDQVGVVVGVDHGHHRDAELARFLDRDVLVADVDHEQRVGQAAEFLQAAQRSLELDALATQAQHLVLDQLVEGAVRLGGLQLIQARHRLLDGAEDGQRAAQPALGHVRHAAALGLLLDRLARAALGAHEQHDAALLGDARDEVRRVVEQRNRLLEVDDVDLAAGAEDVWGHLRVPVARLVAEMHAGFQHLAHGDLGHGWNSRLREPAAGSIGWAAAPAGRARGSGVGPPRCLRGRTSREAPRHGGLQRVCIRLRPSTRCPAWAAGRRDPG